MRWPQSGQESAPVYTDRCTFLWRGINVRYRILTAILLAIPLFLTGCNTLEGAGEDVQNAGDKMEDMGEE